MFDLQEIAHWLDAQITLRNDPSLFSNIAFDSRKIVRGTSTLFLALSGKRRDGHDYIEEAYQKGVRNFMVQSDYRFPKNLKANYLQVSNVLFAVQTWANKYRRSLSDTVFIGITGSNGKTIVKEWLAQLLSTQYTISKSPRSYNSQLGVPLSILEVDPKSRFAIIEAGISQAGEMEIISNILEPDMGILTNIGDAHDNGFTSSRQKLKEKIILFQKCQTIIWHGNQPWINKILNQTFFDRELLCWDMRGAAPYHFDRQNEDLVMHLPNLEWCFKLQGQNIFLENLCHALLGAHQMGISKNNIDQTLLHFDQLEMRMEHIQGIQDSVIINDAYVLDFASLRLSLRHLFTLNKYINKCLILSNFAEYQSNKELNKSIQKEIDSYSLNRLITVGAGLSDLVFRGDQYHFESTEELYQVIEEFNWQDYAILLKGSRKYKLDRLVQKLEKSSHTALLEINLSALQHNLSHYRGLAGHAGLIPVIKASAYGGGIDRIAQVIAQQDPAYIAVAYIDEGIALRKSGIKNRIIILNPDEEKLSIAIKYHLEIEVHNLNLLEKVAELSKSISIPIHLNFDTGMHRLGFIENEMEMIAKLLSNHPQLKVATVFSHLSGSEEVELDSYTLQQISLFSNMVTALSKLTGEQYKKHILNSEGIGRFPQARFDLVRIGLGLYGISLHEEKALQTVYRLYAKVLAIKEFPTNVSIGYNRAEFLKRPSRIATINIGYADGLIRSLSKGSGKVWVKNKLVPIVGNICMDLTMIDITDVPEINVGTTVEIFGENQPLSELAKDAGTIPYEILTGLSTRIVRKYTMDD